MAGVGYNIPISTSLDATSGVDSPFNDDTYILFTGSSLESWQPETVTPYTSTSANSSAAEGNAATGSSTNAGSPVSSPATNDAAQAVPSGPNYWIIIAGAVGLYLAWKKKLI